MMNERLSLSDISFAEGLARAEAHLENALLLLEAGRVPQALVQASRPMIELMPRLSRDLWSAPEVATELNRAIGAVAAGIRSGAQPPALRAALAKACSVIAKAIERVAGPAHDDDAFRTSVAVALLRTAAGAYREAGLHVRFDAVAYVRRARAMCPEHDASLGGSFDELQELIGALEPADPDDIDALVETVSVRLHESYNALLDQDPAIADYLDRIEELIADVEAAYGAGEAFRADKLAALAYVENFAPVKDALTAADEGAGQAVHDSLTGLRLRMRAQASPAEIAEVASQGRSALASLRSVTL
jgi:hypothetical protein